MKGRREMWRKNDYTGEKFGKWTVIGKAPNHITRGGYPVSMWDCVCECGTRRAVRGNDLRLGKSVSCGCSLAENPAARKHGAAGSHLYKVYYGMKARCYNPNNKNYKHYGGRGIEICEEWRSFEAFAEWADKSGYVEGLTIERKDVNEGYCPQNCCWITQKEQTRNKRNTVYITAQGETKTLLEWAKQLNVPASMLKARQARGWTDEEIISIPKGMRRK